MIQLFMKIYLLPTIPLIQQLLVNVLALLFPVLLLPIDHLVPLRVLLQV
jgi:hypothetical protein